jgi:hypothetical protein
VTRGEAEAVARRQWDVLPHELKVSLIPADLPRLLEAIELSPAQSKRRRLRLFDTPSRRLAKVGVTLRLREKKASAELTVKVRPVVPSLVKGRWLKSRTLELEADVVGDRILLSASVCRPLSIPPTSIDRGVLSPLQHALLAELAEVEVPFADLKPTRPAEVTVWKKNPLVIELWKLPGGGQTLEVSATVPGTQLLPLRLWLDLLLETAKVRRARTQTTKTETLLKTLDAR